MKKLIRLGIVGLVLLASLLPCLTISPSVSASSPINVQVSSGTDDGEYYDGTDGFNNTSTGGYTGYIDDISKYNMSIYARWTGISIPLGATITVAYIQWAASATGSGVPLLKIYGINESNPTAPTSAVEFLADVRTTASVDWDGKWTGLAWNTSPDISPIIQELVNASGGIYTGSIMVQVVNDGGETTKYNYPSFYELDPNAAPKLHIEYTVTDPPPVPFVPSGTDYGMWEWMANTSDVLQQVPCENWFINSSFNWIIRPMFDGLGQPNYLARNISNGGNQTVILRTWFWNEPNLSPSSVTWTTMRTNSTQYDSALNSVLAQIAGSNASYLEAITINEEEPNQGFNNNVSLYNIPDYINVSNRLYVDVKAVYPTLPIYAFVHIAEFTGAELDSLSKDGLIDDVYTSNQTTLSAWFTRMVERGGNNTYCLLYGASDFFGYSDITPAIVNQSAILGASLNVPHIGWWSYNQSIWPGSPFDSVIFNSWTCANLSNPNCSQGYKETIFDIIGQTQDYPVPTPTPAPTPAPSASIGGTMGHIVVIVFGLIVILMLMGYSYSEYQRQGFTEGAKVAILGIITIVIAESILIAFF